MRTEKSVQLIVERGVPQGLGLRAALFVLITSDFKKHLKHYCISVMYADKN